MDRGWHTALWLVVWVHPVSALAQADAAPPQTTQAPDEESSEPVPSPTSTTVGPAEAPGAATTDEGVPARSVGPAAPGASDAPAPASPTNPASPELVSPAITADIHVARGLGLLDRGEAQQARALMTEAIAQHPGDARLHHVLGKALLRLGDGPGAVAALQRALALDPRSVSLQLDLGDAHAQLGNATAALIHYRAARELDPHHPGAKARLRAYRAPAAAERPPGERSAAPSRESRGVCFIGAPKDACRTFTLTEVSLLGDDDGLVFGVAAGLMVNLDARWAVGGAFFGDVGDDHDGHGGLRARVRYWLGPWYSLEGAAGATLFDDDRGVGLSLEGALNLRDTLAPVVRLEVLPSSPRQPASTSLQAGVKGGSYVAVVSAGIGVVLFLVALAAYAEVN